MEELRDVIDAQMRYHNRERRHSRLGHRRRSHTSNRRGWPLERCTFWYSNRVKFSDAYPHEVLSGGHSRC